MKILIVTHTSNDIFIYNFAKWIKYYQPNWEIDVFEYYTNNAQGFDLKFYNNVETVPVFQNKYLRFKFPQFFSPFYIRYHLKKYLNGKFYDIIQCHWITSPMIVSSFMKKHCHQLFVTFWGGEIDTTREKTTKLLHSKMLYLLFLKRLLKVSNGIIESKIENEKYCERFPFIRNKMFTAHFGSEPLEVLYKLMDEENKTMSKKILSIPERKTTIMIGYSGKKLHQHILIIKKLTKCTNLKQNVHLIVPMTRDVSPSYLEKVEKELKQSPFSYTLVSGHFLSNEEVARMRNATDIFLQFSIYDGYSRSIVECICAKVLVIYGSWLNRYKSLLEADGFYAIPVSTIDEGVIKLESIVTNFDSYQEELSNNSMNGKDKNIWSSCIKDWINIYSNVNP